MIVNDKIEHEANIFALFLLMPRDILMDELIKLNGIDLSDGKDLQLICKKFQVSLTALAVRLALLSKSDRKILGLID